MNRYGTNGGVRQDMSGVTLEDGLTYDEGVVVVFQLAKPTVCGISCHQRADRPLIDRTSAGVLLEERWGDEWFQHEPSANIDTSMDER